MGASKSRWVAAIWLAVVLAGCSGGGTPGGGSSTDPLSASLVDRTKPVVPKPIASGDYFPAQFFHRDGIIHQWYPVDGFDGPWAEPNGMTDFNGFVAQIFQGGTAVDSAGNQYNVDIDNRVYVGEYIGVDGRRAFGAFCEI
jgi:hypothetical protein